MSPVDWSTVIPIEKMHGEDIAETAQLKSMHRQALKFLSNHKWCSKIEKTHFGFGVGNVIAVFLFEIISEDEAIDKHLWVVNGDVPPAYLVVDSAPDPESALRIYVELMSEWVKAVLGHRSVSGLIPVNTLPTLENALALKRRLEFISTEILQQ